jgi:hypothetical protein
LNKINGQTRSLKVKNNTFSETEEVTSKIDYPIAIIFVGFDWVLLAYLTLSNRIKSFNARTYAF